MALAMPLGSGTQKIGYSIEHVSLRYMFLLLNLRCYVLPRVLC